jgi:hypothetical protein
MECSKWYEHTQAAETSEDNQVTVPLNQQITTEHKTNTETIKE